MSQLLNTLHKNTQVGGETKMNEQNASTNNQQPTPNNRRYQCRHIFTDGHRCGSICLRGEPFCYYHHTTRKPAPRQSLGKKSSFDLPLPEDRSAIQASIGIILQKIASNDLDPRRAGLLLYGLQIASLNLPKQQRDQDEDAAEQVHEITTHPELGTLAPQTEIKEEKSSIARLLEELTQPKPAVLPQIQAVAQNHPSSKPTAQSSPLRSNHALLPSLNAQASNAQSATLSHPSGPRNHPISGATHAPSFLPLPHRKHRRGLCSRPVPHQPQNPTAQPIPPVLANTDRTGELHTVGYSSMAFKVITQDTQGDLFMIEHHMHQRGGPPLHVHPHQDETFYVLEGEFIAEVGGKRFNLHAGDTVCAPRNIPHVWACVGDGTGKMIIAFTPAGKMEPFFNKVSATNAPPPQDAALFRAHDMELLGPPLKV